MFSFGFISPLIFFVVGTYFFYFYFKNLESKGKNVEKTERKIPIYNLITNKRELPGIITSIFCVFVLFCMFFVSSEMLWAWQDAHYDYTFEREGSIGWANTEGPTMLDDYSSDHPFMADGPWIWIGYFAVAVLLSLNLLGRGYREMNSFQHQYKKRKSESALIPMLALDPKCVSEGRVILPAPMEPLHPTLVEKIVSPMLMFTTVLVTLGTLAAVAYELLDGGFQDHYLIVIYSSFGVVKFTGDEFMLTALLAYYACIVVYICYTLFPYFDRPIFDESTTLLTAQMTGVAPVENQDTDVSPPVIESDEPARMDAVIQILEMEMRRARQETQRLKGELDEANNKVVILNSELDEKSSELEDMRVVKKNMEKVVEEQSKNDGKSLTMADSVLVGDALFGSTKIDQQIVNDPVAIARAAIEAYQQGKKDSEK